MIQIKNRVETYCQKRKTKWGKQEFKMYIQSWVLEYYFYKVNLEYKIRILLKDNFILQKTHI